MASKVEQQYKLLNAELMDQVQKQRMEIGAYRKQLIALNHEIMGLREAQVLQNARQRQDNISIIRGLMRSMDIDADCLADRTLTSEKEPETSFVVNRRSQRRRSSRDICQELRRSSALAYSRRTISPTRRRDTIVEVSNEAPESTPRLTHTPPPRRVAELADDGSSEEEPESTTATTEDPQPTEEAEQKQSDGRLFSIIEDSDEETSTYSCSSSSPICCDSTIEEYTPSRRALRPVDPNVVPMSTRGKSKAVKSLTVDLENSTEEQLSIQVPRLCVTRPSQSPVQSMLRSVSLADGRQSSPRHSLFAGGFRMSGTNTSTPIRNRASQQQKKTTTETSEGEGCATTTRRGRGRPRKGVSEPRESDQKTDLSTSCLSSSGRPGRRCRPTQLAEPSLVSKMRNNSEEPSLITKVRNNSVDRKVKK